MAEPSDRFADIERRLGALARDVAQVRDTLEHSPGLRCVYVGDNTVMVRTVDGRKIYVDSRDIGIGSNIMMTGNWEPRNTLHVKRLLRPGSIAVDVGANFGHFSIVMGMLVGETGQVLCFEPNPHVFRLLVRTLKANGMLRGLATAHQCALTDREGRAELSFLEGDFGGGTLYASEAAQQARGLAKVEVEMRTLDSFDIPRGKPLFVKLDAEGAEYDILKGAEKTLRETKDVTMMMEFTPAFIRKHLPVEAFADYLAGFGFSVFEVVKEGLVRLSRDALIAKAGGYIFLARRDISV